MMWACLYLLGGLITVVIGDALSRKYGVGSVLEREPVDATMAIFVWPLMIVIGLVVLLFAHVIIPLVKKLWKGLCWCSDQLVKVLP